MTSSGHPFTAIIVGAGHRSLLYASYSELDPEALRIVGVADPDPERRRLTAERFGFGSDMCFETAEELAARGRLADFIINGTMDHQHVATALPLLRCGYDMILEKPLAVSEAEMKLLVETARTYGNRIMVCHVLRYAPFYRKIKETLNSGVLGDIVFMRLSERLTYHHLLVSYVRGKWADRELCHAPMLLAKCSHDMDLLTWFMEAKPTSVYAAGSSFFYQAESRPEGAAERCLPACQHQDACIASAKKLYLEHPNSWRVYVWDAFEGRAEVSDEERRQSLETDNPHGVCAWLAKKNNVDHETVTLSFETGATAVLHMIGGCSVPERDIHIVGRLGEIEGKFSERAFTLRTVDLDAPGGYREQTIQADNTAEEEARYGLEGKSHGGGDLRLVEDFLAVLRGDEPSLSATWLEDSILGHLCVFRADASLLSGQVQSFQDEQAWLADGANRT